MKYIRRGNITNAEAVALLDALMKDKKILFPLDVAEIHAVMKSFERAEILGKEFTFTTWEKLLSVWNFSYGSIVRFVTWFEPGNICLTHVKDSSGRNLLQVTLNEGPVNWQEMKDSGLV